MLRSVAVVAFFFSGLSSLVFQLVWTRLLHHVFGSSSVAISSVVSVFMGGLALGAWGAGKFADRIPKPLAVYALAEAGVGAWGWAVPHLVRPEGWLANVNAWLHGALGAESFGFLAARFLCILPILIVPTTLMGATLPLLSRYLINSEQNKAQASSHVGVLYGINTFGAVTGVFLAGFVLMPSIGVKLTNFTAIAINFLLALLVLGFSRRSERAEGSRSTELGAEAVRTAPADDIALPATALGRTVSWVAFSVSGAVSLLYEVVWSRALISSIGASVYSFALILIAFLIGIAGGSLLASSSIGPVARKIKAIAIAAAVLSPLANIPLLVHGLRYVFAVASGLSAVAVALIARAAVRRLALLKLLDGEGAAAKRERRWAVAMLAWPATGACLSLAWYGDRLSGMVASVVCAICALLGILLATPRNPILSLSLIQFFIGVATLLGDLWADRIALIFASTVAPLYNSLPERVNSVMLLMSLVAGLTVVAPALGMGAMFPLTIRVWSSGARRIGRDVGVVYTGNTVGSIIGAWLPGFVLMPFLGMQATLHIGIATNLLLSLALVLVTPVGLAEEIGQGADGKTTGPAPLPRHRFRFGGQAIAVHVLAGVIPALIALLYISSVHPRSFLRWNLAKMTLGTFRLSLAKSVLDEEGWGEPEILFYKDGLSTTVSVERWGRHYMLKNNGKVDASNGGDMPTQILVAGYPLLMHAGAAGQSDVAVVGFGSGVTVGAALQFPLRSVDVIELEGSVVQASRFFADANHLRYPLNRYPWVQMPRLRVFNDDARNYLAASQRRYDVIISEPSNPWLTGVSDLFTADHFRAAKKHLKQSGIYCQWVQLYEISPENVKAIYRTFAEHFAHVLVFSAEARSSDTVLLGSDSPLPIDFQRIALKMAIAPVAAELKRADIESPFDIYARVLLASRAEVLQYTQIEYKMDKGRWVSDPESTNQKPCPRTHCRRRPAPLNTDDNALIEFAAPRDLIGFERYSGYLQTIYARDWPYARISRHLAGFENGNQAATRYVHQALALLAHGRMTEAEVFEKLARTKGLESAPERIVHLLSLLMYRERELPLPDQFISPALDGAHPKSRPLADALDAARGALNRNDYHSALKKVDGLVELKRVDTDSSLRFVDAYLLYKTSDYQSATDELEEIIRTDEQFASRYPEVYYFLSRSQYAGQLFDKAVRNMRKYLEATEGRDKPN